MQNSLNQFTKDAWDANAEIWDARMGNEGNDLFNILCWTPLASYLDLKPDATILDIRPLQYYMNLGFENGFVVDGFEEHAFPPEHPQTTPLSWGGKFSEIPPVIVIKMRLQ